MKKLISIITAITLLNALPISTVTSAEETDLKQLASSLGADIGYFNFPNYRATEISDEMLAILESQGEGNVKGVLPELQGGLCNSFAVLEVLNHNGIISPSDLQNDAKTLHDIEFTSDINDIFCAYSILQHYSLQDYAYHEYFCSHTPQEQCQDLIKYGEKAVETGKWFFIAFGGPTISHAIVGIGIADGNWTYNGKNYDKCILTLDSNFQDKNDSTKAAGFTEKACIYINSENEEFYFPAYECDSANEDTYITLVTDDTDMLNYHGYIRPTDRYSSAYDLIKNIKIDYFNCGEYDITIDIDGISETYHGYPKKLLAEITKNQWTPWGETIGASYFRKADIITIETMQSDDELIWFSLQGLKKGHKNGLSNVYIRGKGRGTTDGETFHFKNLDSKKNQFDFYATRAYPEYPFPWRGIGAYGDVIDSVTMKICDDGFVFSTTDNNLSFTANLCKFDYDENNKFIGTNQDIKVYASKAVMIRCKENNDEIYFAIGEDFDIPVETGDVNCDGYVNAVDASLILADYANASTDQKTFLNAQLADYNSDSFINAVDASCVLAEYARLSTT